MKEREYRRLAILGDAIFNAVVVDYLYHELPDADEQELSKLKNSIITREQAGEFAKELNLKQLCLLSKDERQKDESEQTSMFGEMFEALLGAIYLEFERDYSKTKTWLLNRFFNELFEYVFDENETLVTTRDYLDMIGLNDFPDYGWCSRYDDD